MNHSRYFIPNMGVPFMPMERNIPINPMFRNGFINSSNTGVFSKLFNGIKNYNWKGLLSGANKTLNVVNQTIPLIRQAKPMVNNVKSIAKLAHAFGTETKHSKKQATNTKYKPTNNKITNRSKDDNYPTFFV